jgi:hypothetical protein
LSVLVSLAAVPAAHRRNKTQREIMGMIFLNAKNMLTSFFFGGRAQSIKGLSF